MTEIELIKGCINHSQTAQKELFYTYYAEMKNLVQYYCKNEDDVKSIVNQGFMDVFTHIGEFKQQAALKTWIKRIMINRAIQFYRQEKRNQERITSLDSENLLYVDDIELADHGMQNLELKELLQMIQALPFNERSVFNMFVIEGYSHREIGLALDMAEGTSRWYLNNAKKMLKAQLIKLEKYERRGKVKTNI